LRGYDTRPVGDPVTDVGLVSHLGLLLDPEKF